MGQIRTVQSGALSDTVRTYPIDEMYGAHLDSEQQTLQSRSTPDLLIIVGYVLFCLFIYICLYNICRLLKFLIIYLGWLEHI